MRIKASVVGDWLRQIAGKRDHREVLSDDNDLVLRPGPHFDLLFGSLSNPASAQAPASAPERDPAGDDRRKAGDHVQGGRTARSPAQPASEDCPLSPPQSGRAFLRFRVVQPISVWSGRPDYDRRGRAE